MRINASEKFQILSASLVDFKVNVTGPEILGSSNKTVGLKWKLAKINKPIKAIKNPGIKALDVNLKTLSLKRIYKPIRYALK